MALYAYTGSTGIDATVHTYQLRGWLTAGAAGSIETLRRRLEVAAARLGEALGAAGRRPAEPPGRRLACFVWRITNATPALKIRYAASKWPHRPRPGAAFRVRLEPGYPTIPGLASHGP